MNRKLDLLIIITLSPIILLLILIISLLIKINLGSPIFFKQIRSGKFGQPFNLIKFRTMENGLGTDKERLTKFGQILRSTSIDELPEIYNVIRGDMSLVGPRPLLMEYLNLYTDHQRLRNNVRPGITGWAQVNGRNAISWEEKFEFDIWYVKNQSVTLYFKIIVLTIKKVMLQRDINTKDNTTMPIFTGTKKK